MATVIKPPASSSAVAGLVSATGVAGFEPPHPGKIPARPNTTDKDHKRVIDPPEWAAFSLMSIGTVTMLYTVALPKKKYE